MFSHWEEIVLPELIAVMSSSVSSSYWNSSCFTIFEMSKDESLKEELFLFLFYKTFIKARFLGNISTDVLASCISADYYGHLIRYWGYSEV